MSLTARVENGRLVLNEPTDLPEGESVQLEVVRGSKWADEDHWSAEAREQLEEALAEGAEDIAAGRLIDAQDVLAELASRQ